MNAISSGSDDVIQWEADEHHGTNAPPLPGYITDEERALYRPTHTVGQVLGAYWRKPLQVDFELFLKAGPNPLPISSLDLARICTSIKQGAAVAVWATHQEAIAVVKRLVDEETGQATA